MRVGESGVSIGSSNGITIGRGQVLGVSIPPLAAIDGSVGASITKPSGVAQSGSSAWDRLVGSVDTWSRFKGGGGHIGISTIGTWESRVEELGISLSIDSSHKGEKNNLE